MPREVKEVTKRAYHPFIVNFVFVYLQDSKKPVVAAISGSCLGGGCEVSSILSKFVPYL